jgi:hypothetical protein
MRGNGHFGVVSLFIWKTKRDEHQIILNDLLVQSYIGMLRPSLEAKRYKSFRQHSADTLLSQQSADALLHVHT